MKKTISFFASLWLLLLLLPASKCFTILRGEQGVSTNKHFSPPLLMTMTDDDDDRVVNESWEEQHLIHDSSEIHEENDDEMLDSEVWAAFDAHDCDDPGMEAAVMERAVMMAAQMASDKKRRRGGEE